jgi:Fibronectin type III domain
MCSSSPAPSGGWSTAQRGRLDAEGQVGEVWCLCLPVDEHDPVAFEPSGHCGATGRQGHDLTAVGTGPASAASSAVTPTVAPTVPGAPTNVTATAGDGSAVVSWTAPSNGGSAITSYTVTPFIGSTAQTPTTVSGSPPATTATVTGLTNGTAYTFKVSATNAVGTGPASAASNAVTPTAAGGCAAARSGRPRRHRRTPAPATPGRSSSGEVQGLRRGGQRSAARAAGRGGGGDGVYAYSSTSGFPNNTWQSSNYWVDVVFTTG